MQTHVKRRVLSFTISPATSLVNLNRGQNKARTRSWVTDVVLYPRIHITTTAQHTEPVKPLWGNESQPSRSSRLKTIHTKLRADNTSVWSSLVVFVYRCSRWPRKLQRLPPVRLHWKHRHLQHIPSSLSIYSSLLIYKRTGCVRPPRFTFSEFRGGRGWGECCGSLYRSSLNHWQIYQPFQEREL